MASLFRPRSRNVLCQCQRAFSTSSPRTVSLQLEKNDPDAVADTVPEYPHGPTRWYKQSRLGLYGGQRIRFGNNVGKKIEVKTRRTWHPNIITRKLYSKALDRPVQVRVSTRVLRTIDKLGGLDEYLLGEKEGRIKTLGESGWWLRWAIMQTPAVKKRFAEDRWRLGIPEDVSQEEEAESAETEVVIEEASGLESKAAEADGEALSTDDAFEVEQTEGLPPLKFRVGRGKHIVLTPSGWRRTKPSAPFVEHRIAKIQAKFEQSLLPEKLVAIEPHIQAIMAKQKTKLAWLQNTKSLKSPKRKLSRSQKLVQRYNAVLSELKNQRTLATEAALAAKSDKTTAVKAGVQSSSGEAILAAQSDETRAKIAAAKEARTALQTAQEKLVRARCKALDLGMVEKESAKLLAEIQSRTIILSKEDQDKLREKLRSAYRKEIRGIAEAEFQRRMERKEERKTARDGLKREEKAVSRAKEAELEALK